MKYSAKLIMVFIERKFGKTTQNLYIVLSDRVAYFCQAFGDDDKALVIHYQEISSQLAFLT